MIFGIGKGADLVEKALINDKANIVGYLDNNKLKQGKYYKELPIIAPKNVKEYNFDYIIIATLHHQSIIEQLVSLGVDMTKLIAFFSENYIGDKEYAQIFDLDNWKFKALQYQLDVTIERMERKTNDYINNLEYEIADKWISNKYKFPVIKSEEETIKKIIEEKCSMSRFGDGEFEMIAGKIRPKFQQPDHLLGERLKEVINSNLKKHIIAIADNYGALDKYETDAAMAIRSYMTPEVRKFHMDLLKEGKLYFNAYLTRPYIIYRDKHLAKQKFEFIKKIWENRNVLIIEGDKTRMGVGNDLFDKVKSIQRILAPSENAFYKYDDILSHALQTDKDVLILIALGPTATVLAYDLAIAGFQALDIGHIDMEYEWYLKGEGKRTMIKSKYNNELPNGDIVEDIHDNWYDNQIIYKIY
jgi:glycosyltransferase family protein